MATGQLHREVLGEPDRSPGAFGVVEKGDTPLAKAEVRIDLFGSPRICRGAEAEESIAGVSQSYLTADAQSPSSASRGSPFHPPFARPSSAAG